jgi:hypothetical protein
METQAEKNGTALAGELARRLDAGELVPRDGDGPEVQGLLRAYARLQAIPAEPDPAFGRQLYRAMMRQNRPASQQRPSRLASCFSWLRRRPLFAAAAILFLVALVAGQVLYARPIAELPLDGYPVDGHFLPAMAGAWAAPAAGDQLSGVTNGLSGYYVDSYGVLRSADTPPDRMVTRQAYLVLYVKDQAAGLAALQEIIQTQRGLVIESANTLVTGGYSNIVVTFRVPATAFEETIAQVKALGTRVGSEKITSSDVTASYIDLDARLRNLELTETELQDLLKAAQERGDTAADILAIYQSLSEIRGQIEQLRGEKSLLEESVAMAEFEVTLAPEGTVPGFMPGQILSDAWTQLGLVLQRAATGLIYGLVFLLPLLPILGIVFLVWRAYRRARNRTREK